MISPFYKEIVDKIATLKGKNIIIAIDGMCGSGKSTLCDYLCNRFDVNAFHVDDFFLLPEMRTEQRLSEVGGNVHYERFLSEVLTPLSSGREFRYNRYNCKKGELESSPLIVPKAINIVEGAYSLHPYFGSPYSLTISLSIDSEEQLARIKARNGAVMAERFKNEWIPLENRYFKENDIFNKTDLHFEV